jgi:hypothetical protein
VSTGLGWLEPLRSSVPELDTPQWEQLSGFVDRDGRWRLTGEKCWVSRLLESAAFVVFVRDPDGTGIEQLGRLGTTEPDLADRE